jgi:hypothetical protein
LTRKVSRLQTPTRLLHQRLETIDAMRGRIEQLQERNQQLDQEAESYVAMIQRGPLRERY